MTLNCNLLISFRRLGCAIARLMLDSVSTEYKIWEGHTGITATVNAAQLFNPFNNQVILTTKVGVDCLKYNSFDIWCKIYTLFLQLAELLVASCRTLGTHPYLYSYPCMIHIPCVINLLLVISTRTNYSPSMLCQHHIIPCMVCDYVLLLVSFWLDVKLSEILAYMLVHYLGQLLQVQYGLLLLYYIEFFFPSFFLTLASYICFCSHTSCPYSFHK